VGALLKLGGAGLGRGTHPGCNEKEVKAPGGKFVDYTEWEKPKGGPRPWAVGLTDPKENPELDRKIEKDEKEKKEKKRADAGGTNVNSVRHPRSNKQDMADKRKKSGHEMKRYGPSTSHWDLHQRVGKGSMTPVQSPARKNKT